MHLPCMLVVIGSFASKFLDLIECRHNLHLLALDCSQHLSPLFAISEL